MNMTQIPARRSARGFTLIELMIAVAIIGIVAKLAYPAYTQSLMKSRRADAKTALLDLAQREERFISTNNQYSSSASGSPGLGYNSGTTFPINVVSGSTAYYQLSVAVPSPTATGTAPSFQGTATPIGAQAGDTQCGAFVLDNTGSQTVTGTATTCW